MASFLLQSTVEEIEVVNGGMKVSHLEFEDDSIMFSRAVEENIYF